MPDLGKLLESIDRLSGRADKEFAVSALEVSIGVNKHVIKELMRDDGSIGLHSGQ